MKDPAITTVHEDGYTSSSTAGSASWDESATCKLWSYKYWLMSIVYGCRWREREVSGKRKVLPYWKKEVTVSRILHCITMSRYLVFYFSQSILKILLLCSLIVSQLIWLAISLNFICMIYSANKLSSFTASGTNVLSHFSSLGWRDLFFRIAISDCYCYCFRVLKWQDA